MIRLKGAAREHPMFVEGGVPLDVPIESLAVTSPPSSQEALNGGNVLLLTLYYKTVNKTWAHSSALKKKQIEDNVFRIRTNKHYGIAYTCNTKECRKLSLKERFSLNFVTVNDNLLSLQLTLRRK